MESGTRFGPYEILELLGKGGMGEVWLAKDSRLGRKVAIKVLPPEFAADRERVARFEQEARAAAALNHPNIAAVFDVGEHDAGVRYIVQEFLEGQDLHALLQSGPMPRARALGLGAEIAEALAAAHAAGIIHRDLKPQNIFVSPNGHAKVLDFGLAKLVEAQGSAGAGASNATESPTLLGTMAGVVMGSAGYMAPEQAAGGEIDHRADLFACGCVLYEMFVGRRAFEGETLIDTLHLITHSEPDGLHAGNSTVDPDLRWLLEKSLAKEPEARYQSAGDLAVDLRRLAAASGPSGAAGSGDVARTPGWLPWAAAAGALLLGLFAGARFLGTSGDGMALRLSIPAKLPGNITSSYFAISPDGKTVAYQLDTGDSRGLVLRRLDDFAVTPVPGSEGAIGPFFSPDSRKLAFFSAGQLSVVDVAGGTPRRICDVLQINSTGVWADDGFIYFVSWATGTGVYRVSEEGGEATEFLPLEGDERNPRKPRLLPDGNGIAVQTNVASRIFFFDGRPSIPIDRPQITYLAQGRALFVEAAQLFVADYDAATYRIEGEPTLLANDVVDYRLSDTGTIVYRYNEGVADYGSAGAARRLVRYSRDGTTEVLGTLDQFSLGRPAISPDGSMIGTHGEDLDGLFVWDVERGTRSTLFGAGAYFQWGPDSNTVYFQGQDGDTFYIDRLSLDGTVEHERLLTSVNSLWPTDVAADGSVLLYYEIHQDTERDVWLLPLDGRHEPEPFLVTDASERSAVFSPDGRWIAYMSDTSSREEVYVRPRASGEGREVIVTVDGGREPRWSPDGSEIFFRLDDGLWAVPVTTDAGFALGPPELLFTGSFDYEEGGRNQQYDVFPNGDFLMIEREERLEELRIMINWLDEVEALDR